ncbi:MAG: hypothetical protein COW24_05085 [Candidatus Kerfeldbacteria bacterium CG15_BIG_FIL_POST_REV_8_21_14_020_45_12]|uniref:Peptidase C39 domain-containing protein n=1 Tax=Candidatus Kerfeldbacteria bacterium CG15_BIG_FIL_POST_REV_8_21_14_020_45_12 TaxID=2014247 RepID=A0A2M7H2T6_9BACT|nr:MAG: hypothetical protein COW24_05085 [Candidatus Kerfeldbacteria bacterium CG15_BIG_FIL_POST_REV_8_21_14_020_45_12]PJA93214.1 MAG: hypothetical protein CO132_03830 [Candidatus Kerfeldbacteria bacterium CG_4_9_14_3_um_filter_45_8]
MEPYRLFNRELKTVGEPEITVEAVPPLAVPYYSQPDDYSCGAACLKMMLEYNGIKTSLADLMSHLNVIEDDGPMGGLQEEDIVALADRLGARASGKGDASINDIILELKAGRSVMIGYLVREEDGQVNGHFVVAVGSTEHDLIVHDPWGEPNSPVPLDYLDKNWKAESSKVDRWMMTMSPTKKEP